MNTVIKVEHLTKTFASHTHSPKIIRALDDVSLEVYQGEVLGILGPNGAGKTTFLNILSTLLLPDSGRIEILGIPYHPKNFSLLRSLLNMSSGYPNFPWSLTVEENLRFYGRLYGLPKNILDQKIKTVVELFELGDFAQRRFEELSSGTKQKLSLAKALLNDPKIIFLDEPTIGLDPNVARSTRRVIADVLKKAQITVLLTTHNMQEAEALCQRIAFIKQGRILRLAAPEELKRMQGKKDLEQVFIELARSEGNPLEIVTLKTESPGVSQPPLPVRQLATRTHLLPAILFWFRRSLAFTYRNYLFAIRNVFAFAELVFWPVVSLISIGLLGNYLHLEEKALAFVLTGAITGGILQVAQLDVAYSLLYEVWSKSMKHTMLTPIGISENLFGSWLIGILRGSVIFFILGLSAMALFGFQFPSLPVTLIFLLGIFGSAFILGLLVSVLILIFGQKAEITAWMFAYLFMLLGGIYYPIETLPPFFFYLAQWVPITYFLEYFRESFGFTSGLSGGLAKGFGLLVLYVWLGLSVMRYALTQARKKGIIVRLSE